MLAHEAVRKHPEYRKEIRALIAEIKRFRRDANDVNARVAEERLLPILQGLLAHEAFTVDDCIRPVGASTDYLARRENFGAPASTIGIEYKHYDAERRVGLSIVEELLTRAWRNGLDRLILIAKPGFTTEVVEYARREHPIALELVDLSGLHKWALWIEQTITGGHSKIVAAITELSRELARIVARNPHELEQLEWRDLERMLAAVLNELGFEVELTPSSKDGGKDIIVRFEEFGERRTYIIEIKHWRAGKRVGQGVIKDFIEVIAREQRDGGIYLATYGYTDEAFTSLTEIERSRVKFGTDQKIVSLCKTYVKAECGLWSPVEHSLPELLFEKTF